MKSVVLLLLVLLFGTCKMDVCTVANSIWQPGWPSAKRTLHQRRLQFWIRCRSLRRWGLFTTARDLRVVRKTVVDLGKAAWKATCPRSPLKPELLKSLRTL